MTTFIQFVPAALNVSLTGGQHASNHATVMEKQLEAHLKRENLCLLLPLNLKQT